jgi:GNAT superfamily N-acetyltransferase
MQTPPYPLLCSGLAAAPAATVEAVVAEVARRRPDLIAIRGLRSTAVQFADLWHAGTGCAGTITTEERLYRLATLRPPVGVPGAHRMATATDTDIIGSWWAEFYREAFGGLPPGPPGADPVLLWVVERTAVSMARVRPPVPGTGAVSRIGPVYTPAQHRGHGYGSAVTAAAAGWVRRAGAVEVVLFTDLANPVSNAIYQRIGFEPIADSARIDFRPTA